MRDVENLFGVGETRQRAQPRRAVLRVTADRAQRLRIVEQIDDGGADLRIGILAGRDHHFLEAAERDQLPNRL